MSERQVVTAWDICQMWMLYSREHIKINTMNLSNLDSCLYPKRWNWMLHLMNGKLYLIQGLMLVLFPQNVTMWSAYLILSLFYWFHTEVCSWHHSVCMRIHCIKQVQWSIHVNLQMHPEVNRSWKQIWVFLIATAIAITATPVFLNLFPPCLTGCVHKKRTLHQHSH